MSLELVEGKYIFEMKLNQSGFLTSEILKNFNLYRTSKSSKYLQTWVLLGFISSPPIRTFIYEMSIGANLWHNRK